MKASHSSVDSKLLIALHADAAQAEKAYGELQVRLRRFFEWKGCTSPEDLAQETLVRGLVHLSEGKTIYCGNPASYFLGIARNVLMEGWRKKTEELFDPQDPPEPETESPEDSIVQRLLLENALAQLSPSDRDLLIEYTLDDRTEIAERRGETTNALSIRVHRIRTRLKAGMSRKKRGRPAADSRKL